MDTLPKLLTRAFAIGYLLPATAMVVALAFVIDTFGYADQLWTYMSQKDVALGVVIAIALAFTAILLLALNRPLIRTLEGYGPFNPARLLSGYRRMRYRQMKEKVAETRWLWDQSAKKGSADPKLMNDHGQALWDMAFNYPDEEAFVLPTKFGNVLRAFEVYPRVVYGIDSIYGWTRILSVVPKDYREMINDEKCQVDFWVNLWFTGCICFIAWCGLALYERSYPSPWIPFAALLLAFGAARGARIMVEGWGILVMSAFDLFRDDLAKKLGFKIPPTIEKERAMWQTASQVWIYRSAKAAKNFDAYREKRGNKPKQ